MTGLYRKQNLLMNEEQDRQNVGDCLDLAICAIFEFVVVQVQYEFCCRFGQQAGLDVL